MKSAAFRLALGCAVLAASSSAAHTHEPVLVRPPASAARAADSLTKAFGDDVRERLSDPALNPITESLAAGRLARLLEDLHVQFKTFERADDDELGLGFQYSFAKKLLRSSESSAWSLDFAADGNVAFDREVNPDDFLSTTLRVRWFGTCALSSSSDSRAKKVANLPDPSIEDLAAFDLERFEEISERFAKEPSAQRIRSDPDFIAVARSYAETVEKQLPPELIWNGDLHASLESNQDFSSRQSVFGAALGGRLVSWNPDADASRLNVFDFPGAALRWLAGQDEEFRPSGEAWPTVVTGLDLVDASDDDVRDALTDDDSFLRARVEAGLKTRVLTMDTEALFLSAGWRYYQEIDAPAAVRRADTDEASYFQVQLDLPKGWALTYAAGKLPLDLEEDSTFALGFNVQF